MDIYMEEIARAVLLSVRAGLPAELQAVAAEQQPLDMAFYSEMGKEYIQTLLPPPAEYFVGHHPALLEKPLNEFPNVTVMCYQQEPKGDPNADHYETLIYNVYVEAFVQDDDQSAVNRLAWRYAKALHRTITKDPDLSRLVKALDRPPVTAISNAAARRVDNLSDEITYLQGCRLDYAVEMDVAWYAS